MYKEATKILLEVFIITMVLTFSIPIWQDINTSVMNIDEQIASLEQGLEIYALNESDPSMIDVNSDFKSNKVVVYNSSSVNRNGKLLLMYSKLSTLDYNHIMVSVNSALYDLSSLLQTINKDYYVFLLENVTLEKYASQEYLINFNVKEDVLINNILGKYFDSNIEIIEN